MPNIDLAGKIYFTNGASELYSLNPDGALNWNVNYESGFFNESPSFAPDGQTIYIAGRDSNLFALNIDGTIKWKYSVTPVDKGPLVDSGGNIYFDSG